MTVSWCRILKWFTGLSVRLSKTIFECENSFLFNKKRRNVRMFKNGLVVILSAKHNYLLMIMVMKLIHVLILIIQIYRLAVIYILFVLLRL